MRDEDRLHPAIKHKQFANTDELAHIALIGGRYHLECIRYLLKPDTKTRIALSTPDQVNRFHWHLRSLYWELVGVWDLLLQWSNAYFDFSKAAGEVRWPLPKRAKRHQKEWERIYKELETAYDSDWLYEIRMYRNHAHRSFVNGSRLPPTYPDGRETLVILEPVRDGQPECSDVREQLLCYVDNMHLLCRKIFDPLKD